jgi:AmmeMemoRadiSam system protein B
MSQRKTSVAGRFYPARCSEIKRYIEHFNILLKSAGLKPNKDIKARAIISPHAGYIYSGFTANAAYKTIEHLTPKRVIVIGPSHRVYLDGASVAKYDRYETPCGKIDIDKIYSKELMDRFDFIAFDPKAHSEHSTETQMPFVEHYFPDTPVVEIVYGQIEHKKITKLFDFLLQDGDNFLIISTDLSHYHNLQSAKRIDSICLKAIDTMDVELLSKGCEACGMVGVKALIDTANKISLKSSIIDYRTSADVSGDNSKVVGYVSAVLCEK